MPKLIFIGERFGGRIYEFALEKTTVGRGAQNTLAIHDSSVSLSHCEILVNGPEVIVCDLGSANGTFVNGLRVNPQGQIKSGQTIRFGSVEARLELGVPEYDDTASEETAVFAMRRSTRDKRREDAMPKPSADPVTFDSDTSSGFTDQTIVFQRPSQATVVAIPDAPAPTAVPALNNSKARLMMIAGAAALGIAFCLWMIFIRK